jgi:iron complex transport system substrate-binding protein
MSNNFFTRPIIFGLFLSLAVLAMIVVIEIRRRESTANQSPKTELSSPLSERVKGNFPRDLTDSANAKLTIKEKPQRIVSQTLATDEILMAICEPQRIAALSSEADNPQYSNIIEEAKQVRGRVSGSAEQILQLKPDLIFVASYSKAEFYELLKAANAPFYRFSNFDKIEDIKSNIRIVGYAIGEDQKAEDLVLKMEREIEATKSRTPKHAKPLRVMSYSLSGYTAGANTLFDEILKTVGAVNVSTENKIEGFGKISSEQLTKWNPDVIIASEDRKDIEITRQNLLNNAAVAVTNAGKNKRVIVLPNDTFLSISHHVTKAIDQISQELYKNNTVSNGCAWSDTTRFERVVFQLQPKMATPHLLSCFCVAEAGGGYEEKGSFKLG